MAILRPEKSVSRKKGRGSSQKCIPGGLRNSLAADSLISVQLVHTVSGVLTRTQSSMTHIIIWRVVDLTAFITARSPTVTVAVIIPMGSPTRSKTSRNPHCSCGQPMMQARCNVCSTAIENISRLPLLITRVTLSDLLTLWQYDEA